ncbi:MAG: hypothetical protein ACLU37_10495 [Collinsella sp.]
MPMTPRSAPRRPRFPEEELAAKNAEKAAKLNDAFQGKADAKSVAAGAAAEAVSPTSLPPPPGNDRQRPQRQARARALPGRRNLGPARQRAGQGRQGARHQS